MFKEYIPNGGWIKENARRARKAAFKEALKTTGATFAAVMVFGFIQAITNV